MMNGLYKHFRNGRTYEVIGFSECGQVIYQDVLTKKFYLRERDEFFGTVSGAQRFSLIEVLATRVQLAVQTLRNCFIEYHELTPGTAQRTFKYMVGDKVSMYYTLRVISKRSAEKLLVWINNW